MAPTPISRRTKALTLLPLVAASTFLTASSFTGASATRESDPITLPGGELPDRAVTQAASASVRGSIARAVPRAAADQVVVSSAPSSIPAPAISAYQRGAQIMDRSDTRCNLPWELLAAIGRVESDHGRFGGNTLTGSGLARPGIFGIRLNGTGGTARIVDTDAGELDKDPKFDRAVGPMQFLPATWQVVKVDSDGDGKRNPQDIDDAALAAGVYLCSGNENLATHDGRAEAVYRYNHSRAYVDLVLRIAEAYADGEYDQVPAGVQAGTLFSPAEVAPQGGIDPGPGPRGGGSAPATTVLTAPQAAGAGQHPGSEPSPTQPAAAPSPGPSPTAVTATVTQVVQTLTSTAALALCRDQLAVIPDPLGLLDAATAGCASRVQGRTREDAIGLIPNGLTGVLAWLGL